MFLYKPSLNLNEDVEVVKKRERERERERGRERKEREKQKLNRWKHILTNTKTEDGGTEESVTHRKEFKDKKLVYTPQQPTHTLLGHENKEQKHNHTPQTRLLHTHTHTNTPYTHFLAVG